MEVSFRVQVEVLSAGFMKKIGGLRGSEGGVKNGHFPKNPLFSPQTPL